MRYLAIITARQGKEIAGVRGDLALSAECGAAPAVSGSLFAEQVVPFLCKLGLSRDEHVSTVLGEFRAAPAREGLRRPLGRMADPHKISSETPDLRGRSIAPSLKRANVLVTSAEQHPIGQSWSASECGQASPQWRRLARETVLTNLAARFTTLAHLLCTMPKTKSKSLLFWEALTLQNMMVMTRRGPSMRSPAGNPAQPFPLFL